MTKNLSIFLATNVQGLWEELYRNFKDAYLHNKMQLPGSGACNRKCDFYENLLFLTPSLDHRESVSSLPTAALQRKRHSKNLTVQPPVKVPKIDKSVSSLPAAHTLPRRSIWLNNNDSNNLAVRQPIKVPELDKSASTKLNQQQNSIEILHDAKKVIEQSTAQVISAIRKPEEEQKSNTDDYFQIFYEKMNEVNVTERDDCLVQII